MKIETVKYVGLCFIVIALIVLNVNMFYRMFFAKNRLNPDYKKPVAVTNEDILRYADSVFVHGDSLTIIDDAIESNKQIITEKEDTFGFSYIVNEPINCPSCSDINYLLFTDSEYTIRNIIFLRDIIEDYKVVQLDSFGLIVNQFLQKNLIKDDFSSIQMINKPKKYSKYFKESIIKVQEQARLFYEK